MGAINLQRPEFVGTGLRMGQVIVISDSQRSWGNGLDFGRISANLRAVYSQSQGAKRWQQHGRVSQRCSLELPAGRGIGVLCVTIHRVTGLNARGAALYNQTRYCMFFGDATIEKQHWSRIAAHEPHQGAAAQPVARGGRQAQGYRSARPVINACFQRRLSSDWLKRRMGGIKVSGDDPLFVDMPGLEDGTRASENARHGIWV